MAVTTIIIMDIINYVYLCLYEYICPFLEVIINTCDCMLLSVWDFPRYGYNYGYICVLCVYACECVSMFYGR